ncbi:nicotinamide-nucleotide adenylyltransferase [Candidatus Woesearchaeota archaeon]|nr:nicotinamide-nucleotide adenylyltransferase [Candidatus Woesearchaeota archaeon]
MTTALFVGRFQPFHQGHLEAVKQILKENDKIIIGIGSSQYSNTEHNPFTAEERKQMIDKTLKANNINNYKIVFIPDIHDGNRWASYVENLIPKFNIVYTNSQYTKFCFDKIKKYPIKPIKITFDTNSTEIRNRIKQNKNWKELVPKEIAQEIERINSIKRIKETSKE